MRAWSRVDPASFQRLDLRAHELLADVPLHDVWMVETVHAFSVLAFEPCSGGYRLFWAIYVAPVSRLTVLYMALIDPFRRALIYPAVLRHVHQSWCIAHQESAV